MKRQFKFLLWSALLIVIAIAAFISFGIYAMEIEDHYGELEEIYYQSKDGDVAINLTRLEIGIVKKTWKRIYVKTKAEDSTDLYNWVYANGAESRIEIYRSNVYTESLVGVSYSDLRKLVDDSQLVLIAHY